MMMGAVHAQARCCTLKNLVSISVIACFKPSLKYMIGRIVSDIGKMPQFHNLACLQFERFVRADKCLLLLAGTIFFCLPLLYRRSHDGHTSIIELRWLMIFSTGVSASILYRTGASWPWTASFKCFSSFCARSSRVFFSSRSCTWTQEFVNLQITSTLMEDTDGIYPS